MLPFTQTHYFFLMMARIKNITHKKLEIEDLGRRVHVFGVLGLISLNFVQSSILFPILAWIGMITLVTVNGMSLSPTSKERPKTIFLAVFEMSLMAWFCCLIFTYIYHAYT